MNGTSLDAARVIRLLGLEPHPEGGHYRETYRDSRQADGRAASTAIYYLLRAGERSAWHRIDAAELWHWYAGSALLLRTADGDGAVSETRLGPGLAAGERPQAVVPAYIWQEAVTAGAWTLAGCTVAPGFDFDGFELAPEGWRPGG